MQIETRRLRLREFLPDDWHATLRYHADPRYQRSYEAVQPTPESEQAFVQRFLDWQHEQPRRGYQLAVTLREDGLLIGSCGLRVQRQAPHGTPDSGYEADIGYEIDPTFWGRGYASEAAAAMLAFAFERLGLHRVWAYCLAENGASVRVLEKLGMRREGRLREQHFQRGRWRDTLLYAVLAAEWEKRPV